MLNEIGSILTLRKRYVLGIFLFPFIAVFVYGLTVFHTNIAFFISNLAILFISFLGISLNPSRYYSLVKLVFVFFFFFFGVVPLNDELNNNYYWGGAEIDLFYKVIANLIIIIGLISFIFGSFFKSISFDRLVAHLPKIKKIRVLPFLVLFLLVGLIILMDNNFNLMRLLFRGVVDEASGEAQQDVGQAQSLILSYFIRPIPFICLAVYICARNNSMFYSPNESKLRYRTMVTLLILGSVFLVAPTSIARFQAAALYIPLVIIFTKLWERPYGMQLSILGGLLIVMPFLDKFRRFDSKDFSWDMDLSFLNHGHFDAYQSLVRSIEVEFHSFGEQLSGALLFFVPRSIWNAKPLGSGAELAERAGYSFKNISMPYIAEGYANFGVFGVIIFMFVLGLTLGNFDRIAWYFKRRSESSLFLYYYYFLFGMIFFMMRGDLMSSFAFLVGFTVSFWSVVIFVKITSVRFRV